MMEAGMAVRYHAVSDESCDNNCIFHIGTKLIDNKPHPTFDKEYHIS